MAPPVPRGEHLISGDTVRDLLHSGAGLAQHHRRTPGRWGVVWNR